MSTAPKVRVRDAYGNAVSGTTVNFSITSGTGASVGSASASSDGSGEASSTWTVGTVSGQSNTMKAEQLSLAGTKTVNFSATVTPANASKVVWVSAPNSERYQAKTFSASAKLQDQYSNDVTTTGTAIEMRAYDTAACTGGAVAITGDTNENTVSGTTSFSSLSFANAGTVYVESFSSGLTDSACQTVTVYGTLDASATVGTVLGGANSTVNITGGKSPYNVSFQSSVSGTPALSPSGSTASTAITYTAGSSDAGCGTDTVRITDALGQVKDVNITAQQVRLAFITTATYNYGSLSADTSSTNNDTGFRIKNFGCTTSAAISLDALSGAQAASYSIQGGGCSGATLAQNGTCTQIIDFLAGAASTGTHDATFSVNIPSGVGAGRTATRNKTGVKP